MTQSLVFILLTPPFFDSLRVTFGVRLMGFFAVSLVLIVWLVQAFINGKFHLRYSPMYWLLLLFGASAFLSTTSPIGSPLTKLFRAASLSYTQLFMSFLLINVLQRLDQVRRTLYMVICLCALSAIIALWQFWLFQETGINHSFAMEEQMFRETAVGTFLRATALGSDPNVIAIILAVAGVWCLYFGLSNQGARRWSPVTHYLVFLLIVGGVIVTFSRSALVSLFVVPFLLALKIGLSRRLRWVGAAAALVGVLVLISFMTNAFDAFVRMFEESSGDILWRVELNRLALEVALENPITGVGVDAFRDYKNPYDLAAHNLFMQLVAEMGIPGLLIFVVLFGFVGVRLVRCAWQAEDAQVRSLFLALILGYVAKLISHLSNPILTDSFFWFYVGLSEAAVVSAQPLNLALSADPLRARGPERL